MTSLTRFSFRLTMLGLASLAASLVDVTAQTAPTPTAPAATVPAATATPSTDAAAAPAATQGSATTSAAPAARGPRTPPNTHGVDMLTQMAAAPAGAPAGTRYFAPMPKDPALPTFWLIGDSTVRNGTLGDGTNMGQWGWGAPLTFYFDPAKVNVVNRAFGGTTSLSFYNAQWKNMVDLIKKGDVVIMQFGTNSGRGEIAGIGDETQPAAAGRNGEPGVNHTFGWYLRQFIAETRAHGGTPIVASLVPRRRYDADGKIGRSAGTQAGWARQVAAAEGVPFVDLNEIGARKYDELGQPAVEALFSPAGETVHTGWDGSVVLAESVVSGLKALKSDPLAGFYSDKGKAIAAVDLSQPAPPAKTPAPAATTNTAPAAAPAAPATTTPAATTAN